MADPQPPDHQTFPPSSPLWHIRSTPHCGRAVFASRALTPGTLILRAEDLTLNVVLREYRREVCAWCFAYAHGRDLPIRDSGAGMWFCSRQCLESWKEDNGGSSISNGSDNEERRDDEGGMSGKGNKNRDGLGIQAWKKVEELVRLRTREDSEMVDMDVEGGRPDIRVVRGGWKSVEGDAELIREAREAEGRSLERLLPSTPLTKAQKRAVNKALQGPINPDILSFLLSGLLSLYQNPSRTPSHLPPFLALATDPTPYHSLPDLESFLRSYLHLLCTLPPPLIPLCTPTNLRSLSERDSHNSFGIRSLEDDGSEFFGYGCWPSASYFNHSCAPNVSKRRVGRSWEFRGVKEGEELCISYLSGEERLLGQGERMRRLERNWGFECGCEKCEVEVDIDE
ncbi:hypothetical protein P154DRAFT_553256 [Amniculicola lignicola CBS 123094]|uniref:SET domain-containing protein n=1 Tax=Amniculicola lignicola CBS 123094 TaxID=1392246 RepID=A0A6A5WWK9_9PLEO|nr:hypothetical protein P154DRAFT_553256 [Amniculicola lignicola CBS 123094]